MSDQSTLDAIERFWSARVAGDKAAVFAMLSPSATYEMIGAKAFAEQSIVGPGSAAHAADQLIDAFQFHARERLSAIADGQKAAVICRFVVSYRGGAPVTTEACDIFEFDDAGKIASLKQFVDTDLVRRVIEGG